MLQPVTVLSAGEKSPTVPATFLASTVNYPPKLQYSRDDAAYVLSISLRTLDRLIAEKQIAVRRIGRRVLITHDALAAVTKRDRQTGVAR